MRDRERNGDKMGIVEEERGIRGEVGEKGVGDVGKKKGRGRGRGGGGGSRDKEEGEAGQDLFLIHL